MEDLDLKTTLVGKILLSVLLTCVPMGATNPPDESPEILEEYIRKVCRFYCGDSDDIVVNAAWHTEDNFEDMLEFDEDEDSVWFYYDGICAAVETTSTVHQSEDLVRFAFQNDIVKFVYNSDVRPFIIDDDEDCDDWKKRFDSELKTYISYFEEGESISKDHNIDLELMLKTPWEYKIREVQEKDVDEGEW